MIKNLSLKISPRARKSFLLCLRLIGLFYLLTQTTLAQADLRVQVQESVNGAKPVAVTHWFGDDRTMRDDGNRYIVTSLVSGTSTIVNRETQTYQVVPLMLRSSTQLPEVIVTRTNDTRMIGQWPVRRYRLSGAATRNLTIDIWVTQEVEADVSAFRDLMISLGNRPGSEWLKAYELIEGFPILQQVELTRPGIRLLSESRVVSLQNVATKNPDIYAPPDYYKRLP